MRVLRRDLKKPPEIADEAEYCRLWWLWWGGLQPEWRLRDSSGRPVPGGNGDWDVLKNPGKNGLMMVLLSLSWWHGVLSSATRMEWQAAVIDVSWVISSMAQSAVEDAPSQYVYHAYVYVYFC